MAPTTPYKGELQRILFKLEDSFGTESGSNTWRRFGITHGADLPDLDSQFDPQWHIGEGRNWQFMPKPKLLYTGTIPNIWVQNGQFFKYILGSVSTAGSDPYTHTISEASQLPSFTLESSNKDASESVALVRRWQGCKVNRATFEAREGEQIILNLDEFQAKSMTHNKSGVRGYAAMSANSVDPLTTQPYFFFEGAISIAGSTIARIRSWRLEVNNNNEAPYYCQNGSPDDPEIYSVDEGRRMYRFSCQYDVDDETLFAECLKAGPLTDDYYGLVVTLTFDRGNDGANDRLYFKMPSDITPSVSSPGCFLKTHPINQVETPLIPADLEFEIPSLEIEVSDSLSATHYV